LERARRQVDALEALGPRLLGWCSLYRSLLDAEMERRRAHREGAQPLLPPQVGAHVTSRKAALDALRTGDALAAATALSAARGPALTGGGGGVPFTSGAEADDALGSVLEVFAGGRYLWVPFERIRRLEIPEPRHLIDTLWMEARLDDRVSGVVTVHLPVLYEGT